MKLRKVGERRLGSLPLFYKLLVPFFALILIVGAFGAFMIVRDLNSRARASLTQDLSQASLGASAFIGERELYLLESASLAANLQGMAEAVAADDEARTAGLISTVLALKESLSLLVVADGSGKALVEFSRPDPSAEPLRSGGNQWAGNDFVAQALNDPSGAKHAGFLTSDSSRLVSIAAPICSRVDGCSAAGVAIVGIDLSHLATGAASARSTPGSRQGLTIYDLEGNVLSSAGLVTGGPTDVKLGGSELVRRSETAIDQAVHTIYASLEFEGTSVGMIAVSLPTAPVFDSVREAGARLAVVLAVALVGIVGIGAVLTRLILRRLRAVVETNRALGQGDLSARAPVTSSDEIGELALGLNEMAAKLQASHETLEMRVEERTREVERLLDQRTEFFASLSHELRTPLAVIISQAKMLQAARARRARWWTEPADTIYDSAEQLLAVVNDILDLARMEAGGIRVDPTEVSLADAIKNIRRTAEGLASQAGIGLNVDIDKDLPDVFADRARLKEIVLNLVENAVKYTPSGGKIELSAFAHNGTVTLEVADNGVGIPAGEVDKIFEPFYRARGVEPQHGQPSSGLGLALTQRLIKAQSGEITVSSKQGKGTKFTVAFPTAGGNKAASKRKTKRT